MKKEVELVRESNIMSTMLNRSILPLTRNNPNPTLQRIIMSSNQNLNSLDNAKNSQQETENYKETNDINLTLLKFLDILKRILKIEEEAIVVNSEWELLPEFRLCPANYIDQIYSDRNSHKLLDNVITKKLFCCIQIKHTRII